MTDYMIVDLLRADMRVIKPIPCTVEGAAGFFTASAGPFMAFAIGRTEAEAMTNLVARVGYTSEFLTPILASDPWWRGVDRCARKRHIEYMEPLHPGWEKVSE